MRDNLPYFMFAISIFQFVVAIWLANRSRDWRNSDELKGVETRLSEVEGQIEAHSKEFKGDIKRIDGLVDRLEKAVNRVEGFFFQKGA